MGLFSSDESETDVPDERVQELVDKAQSDTVTKERLTQTDTSGIVQRGIDLEDEPLADYLKDGEQIKHIIFNSLNSVKPVKVYDSDSNLAIGGPVSSVVGITDERFVVLLSGISGTDGDVDISIPLSSIESFEVTGLMEAKTDTDRSEDWPIILLQLADSSVVNDLLDITNTNHGEFENSTSLKLVLTDGMDDMEEVADYLSAFAAKREGDIGEYIGKQIEKLDNDEGLGPLFDEEPDESDSGEAKVDDTSEIQEEVRVSTYHVDEDKASDLPASKESIVTLDDSGVRFNEGEYELPYDQIASVREHRDARVQGTQNPEIWMTAGVEIITNEGGHIVLYELERKEDKQVLLKQAKAEGVLDGAVAKLEDIDGEWTFSPEELTDHLERKVAESSEAQPPSEYILVYPRDNSSMATLKVEGWTDGSSEIDADVNASSQSKGKSRGIEIGPFTRSKTSSKSSIEGDIAGEITDNTYTTDITAFKLYEENLIIDSDIKLDLHYSEVDNIYEQEGGVIIEVGSTTFRIDGVSVPDQIGEAVSFVKEQMDTFAEEEPTTGDEVESTDSADKLRELKELHEDGILTDEEFQSKKEELLDEF